MPSPLVALSCTATMIPSRPRPPSPSLSQLPTELTTFIGRQREQAALKELLERSRLVTLTGAAGSGKTRLALELVRVWSPAARPVAWVELAPLRDPGLVVTEIAEAVGLRDEIKGGKVERLAQLLQPRPQLLVLDNCEHLVDACAEVADTLLRQCAELVILGTSREALGVPGERAWLVPPLSLPTDGAPGDVCGESEAVRLFVERARDVSPSFELTAENAGAVADICRRLDGIPLALELAAARVKVLSPFDIRSRLDDIFQLLTSGGRTAVPRHRTLRAAIDWSHDLLPEHGRVLLRRLAVFRGGFDLEAAEQVAGDDTEAASGAARLPRKDVLELVSRLVDRSLTDVREHMDSTRYALLEAVRQYATERLVAAGEEQEVRRRHARHVLRLVEQAEPHLIRRERPLWVRRLQTDLDNIRSALTWSRDHDPDLHIRMVGRLWWFWFSTQHWTEGGLWIDGALELPASAEPSGDRALLLFAAGALAALQVRTEAARPALREAVELAERLGDERLHAYALNYLGMTYAGEGREEAAELCGRAETWFREHDDLYGLRLAALLLGSLAMGRGELELAERKNREGVEVARRFGLQRELAVALQNLAVVHITQGRLEEAEARVLEALAASRTDPSLYFMATGFTYLGEIRGRTGRAQAAARLLGAAESIREQVGAAAFATDQKRLNRLLPELEAAAGEEAWERAWAEGRALTPRRVLDEVLPDQGNQVEPANAGGATASPAASDSSPPAPQQTAVGVPLLVQALGPLLVVIEGDRLPQEAWPYAKPRELLVYLLIHPAGGTRDQIGEALWPGIPRSRIKNSFHVTLHHLRRTLGHPEWVVTEADRYRLPPSLEYRFDADLFLERGGALLDDQAGPGDPTPEEVREVLSLYRGDLLEGETAGRWLDDHRDRLRRLYVELSLALGAAVEATDPAAAADLYQRLLAREELDEEIHRRLMTSWARAGDRVRALRHYDRVVELLRDQLDAEPEQRTVELQEKIRGGVLTPDAAG